MPTEVLRIRLVSVKVLSVSKLVTSSDKKNDVRGSVATKNAEVVSTKLILLRRRLMLVMRHFQNLQLDDINGVSLCGL
jgi:hypothetical protein